MKHLLRNTAASYNACVHAKMAEFTHRSFYPSRDCDRSAVLGSGTAQYTQDFSHRTSSEIAASHGYYAGSRGMHGIRTPPSSASSRLSARSRQGQPTFGLRYAVDLLSISEHAKQCCLSLQC